MDILTYTASLPKKRLAAGALLLDQHQHILIVKPVYRTGWLIPGGAVEANESPLAGCQREVTEELGLKLTLGRLLNLDYQPSQTDRTECLHFIFAAPVLSPAIIAQIQLPADELSGYQFSPLQEVVQLLNTRLGRRVEAAYQAYQNNQTTYMENGTAIV